MKLFTVCCGAELTNDNKCSKCGGEGGYKIPEEAWKKFTEPKDIGKHLQEKRDGK